MDVISALSSAENSCGLASSLRYEKGEGKGRRLKLWGKLEDWHEYI